MKSSNKWLSFLLLIATLFSSLSVKAQILYKIEKAGHPISYILGTHHFASMDVIDSIPAFSEAFAKAGTIIGEIDMSQMQDAGQMLAMQSKMLAPADSTLDKVLTPAQLDSVSAALKEIGMGNVPISSMYILKPAALSAQITQMLALQGNPDFTAASAPDMIIQERARNAGKKIKGFETLAEQTDFLFGAPIRIQGRDLMGSIKDIEGERKRSADLTQAYKRYDIQAISTLMDESIAEDPSRMETLLLKRNENWLEKLSALLPSEELLIVVGAGHLPGEKGVLEGLRKAGYTVSPAH